MRMCLNILFIFSIIIIHTQCQTIIPEGEIYPILFGGNFNNNRRITRIDNTYAYSQIDGTDKFQNINGKDISINAIEFDDYGNTYIGGDFHGHELSTKNEIQKIWTECRQCGYENQLITLHRANRKYVMENISLTLIANTCLNQMYFKNDLNTSNTGFYYNTTAAEIKSILNTDFQSSNVIWVKQYVELSNATLNEYK